MEPLKADLHIHTAQDPEDLIRYTETELIDMAQERGYSVLSITNHNSLTYSDYLRDYARERGITLIPGVEATIQGRHVLLYNIALNLINRRRIHDLEGLRDHDNLIVAPHPFFPSLIALRGLLTRHLHLFDAIELCHFYSRKIDFNRPARILAQRHGIPLVGNSDAHQRRQLHTTFSLIHAEPDPEAIFQAIKAGKVDIVTRPLPLSLLVRINVTMAWRNQVIQRLSRFPRGNSLKAT